MKNAFWNFADWPGRLAVFLGLFFAVGFLSSAALACLLRGLLAGWRVFWS